MSKMIILLALAIFLQGALGELTCEQLPIGLCSFSITSAGKRCLVETFITDNGIVNLQCKTSEVMATDMKEYIESDECVSACGVDRNSVGISSDSLLETQFTDMLCSPQCYDNCPNVIDLYYNLALAEGVLLPDLCEPRRTSTSRSMIQLQSSSDASSVDCAPSPA